MDALVCYTDAVATRASRDGGIDVDSSLAVAQVKAHMIPIGRPALQQLYGVAVSLRKAALFFSLMAYTAEAVDWADQVGVMLFRFDLSGEPEAINGAAQRLVASAGSEPLGHTATPPVTARSVLRGFSISRPDAYFVDAANGARTGLLSKEELVWVNLVWLPLIPIRIDYTTSDRRRRQVQNGHFALFESIGGRMHRPVGSPKVTPLPASTRPLPPRVSARQLTELMSKEHHAYSRAKSPEGKERTLAGLKRFGIPAGVLSVNTSKGAPILLPIAVACFKSSRGHRAMVWDASTGSPSDPITTSATQNLSWLTRELRNMGRQVA